MNYPDLERIMALPVDERTGESLVEKWTQRFAVHHDEPCPVCGDQWQLKPHQALALEYASEGLGPFCMMGVGTGKTLTAMLLPAAAGIDPDDVVCLVPASLRDEAERERIHYTYHFDVPKLEYMSYSQLSRAENVEYLLERQPKMFICDEAHALKNPDAARTQRFFRAMRNHLPHLVPMSATFANHSITEYLHLVGMSLVEGSPVPLNYLIGKRWARCLDAKSKNPPDGFDWKHVVPLAEWGDFNPDREGLQRACRLGYEKRLTSAPGVVRTADMSCDADLKYIETQAQPDVLADHLEHLELWAEMPNEDEVANELNVPAKGLQLELGFYYWTDWGEDDPDYEWLNIKRAYDAAQTKFIKSKRRGGIDAPSLVEAMLWAKEPVPKYLSRAWDEWYEVRNKYDLDAMRRVTWVTDEVIDKVVAYANAAHGRGHNVLVWYAHNAVADKLEEKGLTVCRAGERPEDHGICGVSVSGHSRGLNLQYDYDYNIVLTPPANGTDWEQLLGRTHRMGQPKDEVYLERISTGKYSDKAFSGACKSAKFKAETEKIPQKLLLALDA